VARSSHEPSLGQLEDRITPAVLGPSDVFVVSVVSDRGQVAEAPELSVLSCTAHGREPGHFDVALAALIGALVAADHAHFAPLAHRDHFDIQL